MNRLGLDMLTLIGMSPVDHVRIAAELGCGSVSLGVRSLSLDELGHPGVRLYPDWSLETDSDLRRELDHVLRDTGLHISLGEGFIVAPGRDVADYAANLDIMAALGTRRINAISVDRDIARTHDQMAALADLVIGRGMTFIVEFAPTNAINTFAAAMRAVDHIARPECKVMFDAMHFFRAGGSVEDIRALDPALISYAQLCDVPLESPGTVYMQEAIFGRLFPVEGELPLREWVAALPADVEIGVEVPMLQALLSGVSPRDHAARAVAAARRYIS